MLFALRMNHLWAVVACLLAPLSAAQSTWTLIYDGASGGPVIDKVHAFEGGADVVVDVTGPVEEIERRVSSGAVSPVPNDYLPLGMGTRSRFYVSTDGARLLRVDMASATSTGPISKFHVLANDGAAAVIGELDGAAAFQLADRARTIVAFEYPLSTDVGGTIRVFDSTGVPRTLAWSPYTRAEKFLGFRLSKDGSAVAVRHPDRTPVFDCLAAGNSEPLYELPFASRVELSADGRRAALAYVGRVDFYDANTLVDQVLAGPPPVHAGVTNAGLGVVLDQGRVRVLDLIAGTVLVDRASASSEEFRSMDLREAPSMGADVAKLAVGVRVVGGIGTQGRMEVLTLDFTGSTSVESWPGFPMQRLNHQAPTVRFLEGDARVLAWSRDVVQLSSPVR